jgi:CubicO group peptidase (beta-lactamase class C family)
MAKDSVPGLAVAVIRGDTILWEEGFGWADRDARVAATAKTPFLLASLTKTFVATAIMALAEQRRLDLDRPANDYLGVALLWSPQWEPAGATVRRLMAHTAGLSTFDLSCAADQPKCELPDATETIRRFGVLVWPPGEHYDYSNLGYYVLGEIVARAAGRELGVVLRDEVFRPLGMTHSSLGVDPALMRQTAVAYSWSRGPLPRDTTTAPASTLRRSGASSAYASVHDLVLFGAYHMKVRRSGQRAILSDAAIDSMQHSAVPADGGMRRGLGWSIDENRFEYRSALAQGGNDATNAWLRLIPSERIAVAVVANKGVGFPGDVIDAALAALLPKYAAGLAAQRAQRAQQAGAGNPPAAGRLGSR